MPMKVRQAKEMTEHDAGIRIPLTPDEELLGAESPAVESLHTDSERLARMSADLEMGFDALAGTECGVTVFGSARIAADDPHYALGRAVGAALGARGLHRHHRRRAGSDGGRQPRRPRRGCALDRAEHRAALRAAREPLPRPVADLPLLLRAQGLLRALRDRLRRPARRIRHAGRAVRGVGADPDRQGPPLPGRARRARALGAAVGVGAGAPARRRLRLARGPRARRAASTTPTRSSPVMRQAALAQGVAPS